MNEKVMRHKAICEDLNNLYERKNHDYGDSFGKMFAEEGLAMTRIRLGDKFNRFKTLSRAADRTDRYKKLLDDPTLGKVQDESIRDTLMDLANYSLMTIMELEEMEREEPYHEED